MLIFPFIFVSSVFRPVAGLDVGAQWMNTLHCLEYLRPHATQWILLYILFVFIRMRERETNCNLIQNYDRKIAFHISLFSLSFYLAPAPRPAKDKFKWKFPLRATNLRMKENIFGFRVVLLSSSLFCCCALRLMRRFNGSSFFFWEIANTFDSLSRIEFRKTLEATFVIASREKKERNEMKISLFINASLINACANGVKTGLEV